MPLAAILFLAALWFFWPPLELLRVGTGVPAYPRTIDGYDRTSLLDYEIYHEQVSVFETTDSVEQVRQFYKGEHLPPCYGIYVSSRPSLRYPSPVIVARVAVEKHGSC
ncbi:MAG: hypothetical protein U0232_32275 [Thermomicrobiales bacterium]